MNDVKNIIIELLKIFLHGDERAEISTDVNWKEVYHYALIHNIMGIVYSAISHLPEERQPSKEIQDMFYEQYLSTIVQSVVQSEGTESVIHALSEAKIEHVLFKGSILKRDYPIPEMRTMGDVDILIRQQDRENTHQAIISAGFTCTHNSGMVWCYEKDQVNLEIHTNVMGGKPWNGVDFEEYYADAFAHVEIDSGEYTYQFHKEYHFVYLIAHMAKHFRYAGYGIRGYLDLAVFIQRYYGELNWEYIWEELDKLHLKKFAQNMLVLCSEWFDVTLPKGVEPLRQELREQLSGVIFAGGVYGYYNRNLENAQVREQLSSNGSGNLMVAKVIAFGKWLFPGYRRMRAYLPAIEKRPWLLPVAWVVRWYQALFRRGSRNLTRMKQMMEVDESIKEEYLLMKELGLVQTTEK